MQFEETANEGLKREFKVIVPAKELAAQAEQRLSSMKDRVKIPGFRPGKVPTSHMKRVYGRSVMAEIMNESVGQAARNLSAEKQIKIAGEPKVDFTLGEKEIEDVIAGNADLSFMMKVEVLPKIDIGDFKKIKVTKDVTDLTDKDVDEAVKRIADTHKHYHGQEGRVAEKEDRLQIDYEGSIDGVPFDGGKGEDAYLVLGSNQFIPGFEDQLIGTKTGDEKTVNVTFPEQYQAAHLAGKKAAFKVKVKEVAPPEQSAVDDHFAQHMGMESLEKLKEAVRQGIGNDDTRASRMKLKRRVLDALDEEYTFDLPPSLVDQEFEMIWRQVNGEMQQNKQSFEDLKMTEEEAKESYRRIAERRVRLGLLLAEVGEKQKIEISQDEMNRALMERIRQFPGQEKQVYEFYQKNPNALAELRAPIYEDKVIDYILELAQVSDNKVAREELYKDEDEEILAKAKEKTTKKKAAK
ncbi:MAG: trigger factor [Pseudomonadota bacterium]